jgi:hypothetical protein
MPISSVLWTVSPESAGMAFSCSDQPKSKRGLFLAIAADICYLWFYGDNRRPPTKAFKTHARALI